MTPKAIVLTSIHPPTPAVRQFAALSGWAVLMVGDLKTPPDWCCPGVAFISADQQKSLDFKIARALPWNHYARKMIGYLVAARNGAGLLAESDDDNLPEAGWDFPEFAGRYEQIPEGVDVVNIYSLFSRQPIWPRGFPLTRIRAAESFIDAAALTACRPRIGIWQALADDDPDVDAIYRLTSNRPCQFTRRSPVVLPRGTFSPFNSQNTAFRRELLPLMYLPALVNFRVTDILRGYVAQPVLWEAGYRLGFLGPTVRQERNAHDLQADFVSELPLYTEVERIMALAREGVHPGVSISDNLFNVYRQLARHGIVQEGELDLLEAWLEDVGALEGDVRP
jgi:hypothetical protein